MKTTQRIASVIFAVVLMLIGSILPQFTFAASEPVDDDTYVSTATTNAPLPETVDSLTIVDSSVSDADRFSARNIIDNFDHDSSWGAWNYYNEYILHGEEDVAKIVNIIKDTGIYKNMLEYIRVPDDYDILLAINEQVLFISFEQNEVTVHTDGTSIVYTLPVEATWDIVDIYKASEGVDTKPKEPIVTEDCGPGVTIYDSNWKCLEISVEDTRRIATIINDAYVYSHASDICVPDEFDIVIIDNYFSQVIYMIDNQLLVVIDGGSYAYACTIDIAARSDIMAILGRTTTPTIELTDEIIRNLKEISKSNSKLNIAGLDIALVERFLFGADQQAALEIVNILQANGHANDEYLQNALAADSWMDMSSSLMLEIISICEDHIYMVDYSTYGYLVGEVQDYYQNGQKPQAVFERSYHAMCVAIWMKSLNPVYGLE